MLYGLEFWVVDRRIEQSLIVAEIRTLRWMNAVTRENRIKGEYVRGSICAASIVDKMREKRLRWFEHVMRREETKALKVVMKINVEKKIGRG